MLIFYSLLKMFRKFTRMCSFWLISMHLNAPSWVFAILRDKLIKHHFLITVLTLKISMQARINYCIFLVMDNDTSIKAILIEHECCFFYGQSYSTFTFVETLNKSKQLHLAHLNIVLLITGKSIIFSWPIWCCVLVLFS